MMIGVPRLLIVGLAALFSAYGMVLAVYSLSGGYVVSAPPIIAAIVLYGATTVAILIPGKGTQMPVWLAAFTLAVAAALPLLVTAELIPGYAAGYGYGTWYVAAVGTLMTIVSTRRRPGFAWVGIAVLVGQTIVWAGPGALPAFGVIGSAAWVGVSHILTNTLSKAVRDSQRFTLAEREATDWQAAQEAHLNERQFRLSQTSVMALPMLRTIQETRGELSPSQRAECLHLEGAIRDEIRGRRLLNEAVREQVMLARRRGTTVTLLDEGGLDDVHDGELDRILNRLAAALRDTAADKVIVRTVPEGSDVAVTVVGLRTSGDGSASVLGDGDGDDEVELWLEIPRVVPAESSRSVEGSRSRE